MRTAGIHRGHCRAVGSIPSSAAIVCLGRGGVEREVGHKFGRWLDVVVMQRMVGG